MALGLDPYTVLGVSRDATAAQIAQARRRLSRQYHPDVNSAPDATTRFEEVQAAFDLVGDPAARAEYDRATGRNAARQPGAAAGPVHGIVVQPASVNFGLLGPSRPVADATVTVTWPGARPGRITCDQGGEWWTTVGTAASASSCVVLFHLRARAPAGVIAGRRHAQFTATLGGTSVVVPLTAEFSSAVDPTVRVAVKRSARPLWVNWLIVAAVVVIIVVARVMNSNLDNSFGSNSGSGQATASPPAQAADPPASPGQPVRVPQAREAAIGTRPVFTASRAASDRAAELSEGIAGPPAQHGFEIFLPVTPQSADGAVLTSFCVTVSVPRASVPTAGAGPAVTLFTESPLGTVTARGGTDLVFPAVLPGSYALEPHCSLNGAVPMTLGTVTAGNLGVLAGAAGSDPGNAMVVFAIRTSGATTTVTYGAIGQAPSAELSTTPPADDACVDTGQASGHLTYWPPVQSLVSQQVTGTGEWLETGALVFHGVAANSRQDYFHYNCETDIAGDGPGIAVP